MNKPKSKFLSFIFAMMPVLHQYLVTSSGSITLALLVTAVVMLFREFRNKRTEFEVDYIEKSLFNMFCLMLLFSLISMFKLTIFNFGGYFSRAFYMLIFLYFLGRFRRHLDIEYTVKCLLIISSISAVVCLIQLFVDPTFGIYLPMDRVIAESYISVGSKNYYRPNGLFGEPSHCAYYLAITVLVTLFTENKPSALKNLALVFIIFTSCISTSASAIYLLLGVAAMYLLLKKKSVKMFASLVAILVVVLIVINFTGLSDFLSFGFDRINTSNSRMFNGLEYFSESDTFQKLFGCGIGSYTLLTTKGTTFLSGIARILVENGIVGLIFFLTFFINTLTKTKASARAFILFFVMLNLFESAIVSIYLPFIFAYIPPEEDMTKEVEEKKHGYSPLVKR